MDRQSNSVITVQSAFNCCQMCKARTAVADQVRTRRLPLVDTSLEKGATSNAVAASSEAVPDNVATMDVKLFLKKSVKTAACILHQGEYYLWRMSTQTCADGEFGVSVTVSSMGTLDENNDELSAVLCQDCIERMSQTKKTSFEMWAEDQEQSTFTTTRTLSRQWEDRKGEADVEDEARRGNGLRLLWPSNKEHFRRVETDAEGVYRLRLQTRIHTSEKQ